MTALDDVTPDVGADWMLDVDFVFSDEERDAMERIYLTITANPYRLYNAFMTQVGSIIESDRLPARFVAWARGLAGRDRHIQPTIYIQNCPVDRDVPVFDPDEPVLSKYQVKTTFVAEAFLATFSLLRATPPIGYTNVNDGDVFQDIYPKRSMADTQSQKALNEIFFHKDLANHFVRPDHVYMLGLRNDPANEVYTSFVRNVDVYAAFDEAELSRLRESVFYTPFDDLTVSGSKKDMGNADVHPILSGDGDVRFFENRTKALDVADAALVDKVSRVLHENKKRVFTGAGEFIAVYNNHAVHAKEVVNVRNRDTLATRWILKTVNVDTLDVHRRHMIEGTDYLVDG